MKNRIIFKSGPYRIVEIVDESSTIDDLAGDMYCTKANPDIDPEKLYSEYKKFEQLVEQNGAFGYCLEQWIPDIDAGWTHVDSCFGFIGQYNPNDPDYNHEIIDELKALIPPEYLVLHRLITAAKSA